MSTNALIGIKTGKIARAIMVYWDGYPSGVGRILRAHYQDENKIRRLVELGDISHLRPFIHEESDDPFSFDGPPSPDCCDLMANGDDRPRLCYPDRILEAADSMGAEYAYFYRDGEWWAAESDQSWDWLRSRIWQPLHVLIDAETCEEG